METRLQQLQERFGAAQVRVLAPRTTDNTEMILISLQRRSKIHILMSSGLSDYCMPVDEKNKGFEFNEIYFCLPSHWDEDLSENSNFYWAFHWLQRLVKFVTERNTWFGVGHTIPCGNPPLPLSSTMKQNFFLFLEPQFLKEELTPIELADKTIHFLAIQPIFEIEFDYKMDKGIYKLRKRMDRHDITELLDEYRVTALHRKWGLI